MTIMVYLVLKLMSLIDFIDGCIKATSIDDGRMNTLSQDFTGGMDAFACAMHFNSIKHFFTIVCLHYLE